MISTALAHAHATLHIHPETMAFTALALVVSAAAWKIVTAARRRKALNPPASR